MSNEPAARVQLGGQEFLITGGIVRVMSLRDEILDDIADPLALIRLCREKRIPADLLTYTQHLPDLSPRFAFPMEWDNIAAIPISSFEEWLKNQVHRNARNKIYKAQKSGIRVEVRGLDRELVEGMTSIFNEVPVRRGKLYPYYGKTAEAVEKEWSTDLQRSDFLVAYAGEEIVGFIKVLYCEHYARTSGTVAKISHREKAPMNALVSKAVEVCAQKKIPYLIYGKFVYGRKGEDSLTDFKRKNGFQRFEVPRYYVPLSLRGRVGLSLGLHHGVAGLLPSGALRILSRARSWWYERGVTKM